MTETIHACIPSIINTSKIIEQWMFSQSSLLLAANIRSCRSLIWGNTPLHEAARQGHAEVVKKLLMAGATTEVENKEGRGLSSWATLWI